MEKVYAFTDESGNFGFGFEKQGVSSHFIITAIIIKESDIDLVEREADIVRQKYVQTGELKSSKISKKHSLRQRILAELLPLPFQIFSVVVDKRLLVDMPGLHFKQSFYKFLNNIMHKELRHAFSNITIVADEIGGSDYMRSFSEYVEAHQNPPNLYNESDFMFQSSKNTVLIQLADLISGTLGYLYEEAKINTAPPDYRKILSKKIIRLEHYPKTFDTYTIDTSVIADDYDKDIASICLKQAIDYITTNDDNDDVDIKAQVIVLKYLCFRFMNNDLRKYIPTRELMNQLSHTELYDISVQGFRTRIIAKLRDSNVIIASSAKGYKIPSKETELYDFINHGTSIVLPMLERLKKCRDLIKMGTANELDLFDHVEYKNLLRYFDESES